MAAGSESSRYFYVVYLVAAILGTNKNFYIVVIFILPYPFHESILVRVYASPARPIRDQIITQTASLPSTVYYRVAVVVERVMPVAHPLLRQLFQLDYSARSESKRLQYQHQMAREQSKFRTALDGEIDRSNDALSRGLG